MAAYRADIEIAVRGAQELKRLQNEISATSKLADGLNNYLENIGGGGVVRSINNLKTTVSEAAAAFNKAALGTDEARIAATKFAQANDELNAGLQERIRLLAQIRANSRVVTPTGNAGYGQQTPALPPAMIRAQEIGQTWAEFFKTASEVGRDLKARALNTSQTWNNFFTEASEYSRNLKAKSLNTSQTWDKFFTEASEYSRNLKAKSLNTKQSWNAFFEAAENLASDLTTQALGASGRARIRQAENLAAYQAGQPRETFGYGGRQLALRPAGFTDQDVRIKNLLDDQNKAAQISNNLKIKLDKIATEAEIKNIQRELDAEIDKIEAVTRAQKKADAAILRDFDNRLAARTRSNAAQPSGNASRSIGRLGRFGDIASNAIIGGAFPLLFGQTGGAATGGAIGGAVGSLFGGTGGFAGSLLGTLIGEQAGRGKQVKELAADIGFTAEQTELLGQAFTRAGSDFDKFQESVSRIQGLSLSIEDQAKAIQLASGLTEAYGGKIDKVTNAFTNALQTGKVTQATLNQLTSQGIPIQEALAQKYNVSRSALLQMAKDGKISVQDLINSLVEVGNKGVVEAAKTPNAFKKGFKEIEQALGELVSTFKTSFDDTAKIISESTGRGVTAALNYIRDFIRGVQVLVQTVGPLLDSIASSYLRIQTAIGNTVGSIPALTSAVLNFASTVLGPLSAVAGAINTVRNLGANRAERQGPYVPERLQRTPLQTFTAPAQMAASAGRTKQDRKPPEDRTAQLAAELEAIRAIGAAENQIRDALFEGKELTAANFELNKKIADIKRDQLKALENANYASEKDLINQIAASRESIARLEYADKRREIEQKLFEESVRNKEVIQQTIQPLIDFRREQEIQIKYSQQFYRLVKEGILPTEAERIIQFEQLIEQQLYSLDIQIKAKEAAIATAESEGLATHELEKQLKVLKQQREAITGESLKGPGKGKTDAQRLEEALGNAHADLATLTDPINQITAAAKSMGDAFSQAFTGLVSGAMTGREALASFFQGVGDHFMDMATKMIAKLIEVWILQTITGIIGGASGGAGGALKSPDYSGIFGKNFDFGGTSAFGMPRFMATGGLVTRPTLAMIGEGGEPEFVIPASKMDAAMTRYAAGARGASVIPSSAGSGSSPAASGVNITYSGPMLNFNGDEYLPKSAVPELINVAARQGADMGQTRTIRTLQNSRSTRSRIGMQ